MAITFPRPMLCGVQTIDFAIGRFQSVNQLYGGTTQVREQAEPRWRATFTYAPMQRLEFQALEAWLDSLRGGLRTFLAHDALKPFPVNYLSGVAHLYRAGGDPFDGTMPVSGLSASGFTVTTLPANFLLRAGDMVGLVEAGRYGLYRLVEDAPGSAGGLAIVSVEPRVNTALFSAAARANVVRPVCAMTLDAGSIQGSRTAGAPAVKTFSGIQTIL